jgi:hypothetical protein
MEIGPIQGLRPSPVIRTKESGPGLLAILDIDQSARTGDQTYASHQAKPAAPEDADFADLEEEARPQSGFRSASEPRKVHRISFFA